MKGVPYFRDGRLVGLRVTGVRPNGWASDLGVREGDVIEAIDDAPFTDLRETTARLSRGPHPNRLVVLGDEGGSMRRVALAGR